MPHDRNGTPLAVGDRVLLALLPLTIYQVAPNPEAPDQHAPSFQLKGGPEKTIEAEVVEVYEGADNCNVILDVPGVQGTVTAGAGVVERVATGESRAELQEQEESEGPAVAPHGHGA